MHVRGAQYLRTHRAQRKRKKPPKSAPARKKALEVLGREAQDERETYVTKAPKTISCAPGSHAKEPATCTDRT